jgi:chorismate dehydratase
VSRLPVAAIRFLNPAPLMWNFEHPPRAALLNQRYEVQTMMPSQCAAALATGAAALGLVPISAFAELPELAIVPGCAIAAKGAIRSLLLIFRAAAGRDRIQTIAADTSSRATLAYLQVIVRRYWGRPASFLPHAPDLDAMLAVADAALLIGDPALLALEEQHAREERTGIPLTYLDLAAEWRTLTGLPWISAVWGVRPEALPSPAARACLVEDLVASRDAGLAHIDALVEEWAPRLAVPPSTIRAYLSQNIHYTLDRECLEGMRGFYELAAAAGVLSPLPALNLL